MNNGDNNLIHGAHSAGTMGWVIVALALVVQTAGFGYMIGTMNSRIDTNTSNISVLNEASTQTAILSRQIAVLQQKLNDDQKLLDRIAYATGAKGN